MSRQSDRFPRRKGKPVQPKAAKAAPTHSFSLEALESRQLLSSSILHQLPLLSPNISRGGSPSPISTTPRKMIGVAKPVNPIPQTPTTPNTPNNPDSVLVPVFPPTTTPVTNPEVPPVTTPQTPVTNSAFVLINASTNQPIGPLTNGMTIDLSQLPTRELSIVVNFDPKAKVGSVQFGLNDNPEFRLEQRNVWALQGYRDGQYGKWTPSAGQYTLTATPYTGLNGNGRRGTPLSVTFTVVDSSPVTQPPVLQPDDPTIPPPTSTPSRPWGGQNPAPPPDAIPADALYVYPGQNLDEMIGRARSGQTVVIMPGTYEGGILIEQSNIHVRAATYGTVVINGTGYAKVLHANGGENVRISGLVIRGGGVDNQNNHEAAVVTGNGWIIEDSVVEQTQGVGVGMFGNNVIVRRVIAQDNGRAGIGGTKVTNGLMQDCTSRRNNAKGDSNGGGGKFTRVDGFVVERYDTYDNVGVGLWFDYSNINVTVRDSHIHDNYSRWTSSGLRAGAAGIFFEISGERESDGVPGTLVAINNYVHDNDREGIQLWGSQNATIANNILVNDNIMLRDGREDPFNTEDVHITGNTLKDTNIEADGDVAKNHGARRITIDGNTYDGTGSLVNWGGQNYNTLNDVINKLGFEQNGTSKR